MEENETPPELPLDVPLSPAEQKAAKQRTALLEALAGGHTDTLEHRVGIVLNRFPETRDSDISLMLRYWEIYEGYDGGAILPEELYQRARMMSLTRSRARIQNTYRLFQASPEIRKRRGKLSEEEYEKALEAAERHPGLAVLVDESGKSGGAHLIVAAVWFGDPEEFFSVTRLLGEWRAKTGFDKELHFKEIDDSAEPMYREAIEVVLQGAASVSFKAVSVPRDGVKRIDDALEELTYQLLRRGVQHEHDTGRAALPRSVQLWKDQESLGADKLILARLRDRLQQAGKVELDGQLTTDEFESVDSAKSDLMQIADLFAGALNRRLNGAPGGTHAKDRFSKYLLERVGMPEGPADELEFDGDTVMLVKL